jgi:hypothetical protein
MDAGLDFIELLCPIPDFKIYGAHTHNWNFVITCEMRMGKNYEKWTGYTASYRSNLGHKHLTKRIDGIWNNFDDVKKACEDKLRQLKQ